MQTGFGTGGVRGRLRMGRWLLWIRLLLLLLWIRLLLLLLLRLRLRLLLWIRLRLLLLRLRLLWIRLFSALLRPRRAARRERRHHGRDDDPGSPSAPASPSVRYHRALLHPRQRRVAGAFRANPVPAVPVLDNRRRFAGLRRGRARFGPCECAAPTTPGRRRRHREVTRGQSPWASGAGFEGHPSRRRIVEGTRLSRRWRSPGTGSCRRR